MKGLTIAATFVLATVAFAADQTKEQERLSDAAATFSEIMQTPDKGIPQDLLGKAECVVIVPGVKKAAFIVGGQYGRGFATCRKPSGTGWSNPAAIIVEGGSVGFQIGGSETDVVMLVMNKRGMNKLMEDKFTLGADASVAAGPVGRTAAAETDAEMHAEILSWSRARGLFAGIALKGATMRPNRDGNESLYGKKMSTREVIMSNAPRPEGSRKLIAELDRYSSNADRSAH